jgi:hypothetical protein
VYVPKKLVGILGQDSQIHIRDSRSVRPSYMFRALMLNQSTQEISLKLTKVRIVKPVNSLGYATTLREEMPVYGGLYFGRNVSFSFQSRITPKRVGFVSS